MLVGTTILILSQNYPNFYRGDFEKIVKNQILHTLRVFSSLITILILKSEIRNPVKSDFRKSESCSLMIAKSGLRFQRSILTSDQVWFQLTCAFDCACEDTQRTLLLMIIHIIRTSSFEQRCVQREGQKCLKFCLNFSNFV